MKRKPAVAGYFYPHKADALREMVRSLCDPKQQKQKALCVISPHAGFEYSGRVAGAVFSSVALPDKVVLLGPSHRDIQSRIALMKEGEWETPLGSVSVNAELAELVLQYSPGIEEDDIAHVNEHSLEVQLPFIQIFKKDFTIVPVSISYFAGYEDLVDLGRSVSRAIKKIKEEVLIVASTDMSHYISADEAKKKDFLAIDEIVKLDPRGLYDVVKRENISMCGFQPVVAALVACKELGAKKAELIKYQTSGDVTGDYSQVVGYAGIRIV